MVDRAVPSDALTDALAMGLPLVVLELGAVVKRLLTDCIVLISFSTLGLRLSLLLLHQLSFLVALRDEEIGASVLVQIKVERLTALKVLIRLRYG